MTPFEQWLQRAGERPEALDLWQALRRIEAGHPQMPRLGEALRPADEPVRITQPASLAFAPTPVQGLGPAPDGRLRLQQQVFGLLGSNGPLPIHLTELARERQMHHGDPTLQAFLDLLTQRFALLFYRAWSQAQPLTGLDRPGTSPVHRWLGGMTGTGLPGLQERDALGDPARLMFAGRLARQVRDADGLRAWCLSQFEGPLQIRQWCGHWMGLERSERTSLGRHVGQQLGRGAVIGRAVWDVQHKFRIVIGPLRLPRFLDFLPGGPSLAKLQALVRQWCGLELAWDVQLILDRRDIPALQLAPAARAAGAGALGRTAWLGRYRRPGPADDLVIDPERTLHPGRRKPTAAPHPPHPTEDSHHE